jgi:sec-independent protein translocase protein TatB
MFDVGFSELVLVGIVALLVVGPERLPKMAYEVGLWIGRLQRYLRDARFQIENELHNYEIKNSLQQPTRMLEDIKSEIDEATRDPWISKSFTGELPPANPQLKPEPAIPEARSAADDARTSVTANTQSPVDDGQAKPKT